MAEPQATGRIPLTNTERKNIRTTAERELWRGGYSPKAMLGDWLSSGIFSIAMVIIGILWPHSFTGWMILLLLAVLPWLYFVCILTYRCLGIHYLLTTQQLIHETGVLRRVNNRIETLDMNDIAFSQGILQRLAGVGDIRIISTDQSDPMIVLRGIENVAEVAEIFNNARREERRRRGMFVEKI